MPQNEILEQRNKACLYVIAKWIQDTIGDKISNKHIDKEFFSAMEKEGELLRKGKISVKRAHNYETSSRIFQILFKKLNISISIFPEATLSANLHSDELVILTLKCQRPIVLLTKERFEKEFLE